MPLSQQGELGAQFKEQSKTANIVSMPLSQQGELGVSSKIRSNTDVTVSMPLSQQGELGEINGNIVDVKIFTESQCRSRSKVNSEFASLFIVVLMKSQCRSRSKVNSELYSMALSTI